MLGISARLAAPKLRLQNASNGLHGFRKNSAEVWQHTMVILGNNN
jgi:hypothetical protein